MQNWFKTLNDALNSENLIDSWNFTWSPIKYGETRSYTWDDGTRNGHYVTIYRSEQGLYERPVHYRR